MHRISVEGEKAVPGDDSLLMSFLLFLLALSLKRELVVTLFTMIWK